MLAYVDAREESEKEAAERAEQHARAKREAAQKRVEEGTKRRAEALSRKAQELDEAQQKAMEVDAALRERQQIVEEQRRQRFSQPPGGAEKHALQLQRRAQAPEEVKRLNAVHAARLDSHREEADAAVERNRQQVVFKHEHWVRSRRQLRAKAIRKVERTFHERVGQVEKHAEKIRKYEVQREKAAAKRAMREAMAKKEREAYIFQEHAMVKLVRESAETNQGRVAMDSEVEAAIAGGGGGGKKKR